MPTTTANLALTLPTPNVDTGWGSTLNTDFTLIDNLFTAAGTGTSVGINVGSGKTLGIGGTLLLGSGDGTGTTTAPTIRGAARTGTNVVGASLTIDAANGTGTGGSGDLIFRTAPVGVSGTTANTMQNSVIINSAGNVGIGSAPSTKLHVNSGGADEVVRVQGAGSPYLSLYRSGTIYGYIQATSAAMYTVTAASVPHIFSVNSAETMRFTTNGRIGVGATTPEGRLHIVGQASLTPLFVSGYDGSVPAAVWRTSSASGIVVQEFQNSSSVVVGRINSGPTSTSYLTSSDYRLKENVLPIQNATQRVMSLNPVNFAWKMDGSRADGFIAHEAQAVVPDAVTGVKDAVNEDGSINPQGVDQSKLVPLLTAALQGAITKINSLEARIVALEGA